MSDDDIPVDYSRRKFYNHLLENILTTDSDSDITCSEGDSDSKCDHQFDGGHCLECGIKSLCVLCDKEPWETMCNICERGRICANCYSNCLECDRRVCTSCQHCNCS